MKLPKNRVLLILPVAVVAIAITGGIVLAQPNSAPAPKKLASVVNTPSAQTQTSATNVTTAPVTEQPATDETTDPTPAPTPIQTTCTPDDQSALDIYEGDKVRLNGYIANGMPESVAVQSQLHILDVNISDEISRGCVAS